MKKLFRKYLLYLIFILLVNVIILTLFTGKINPFLSKFFESIEDKTFDIRQEITSVNAELVKHMFWEFWDGEKWTNLITSSSVNILRIIGIFSFS